MKAAIITGIGQISIETVEDPKCEDREVIIEVAAAGICGTDLHILEGEFAPSLPIIPGHEFSGKIVEIGKKVTEYKVGQLVAADPSLFCGECFYCKRARGNLCLNWNAIGVTFSDCNLIPLFKRFKYNPAITGHSSSCLDCSE